MDARIEQSGNDALTASTGDQDVAPYLVTVGSRACVPRSSIGGKAYSLHLLACAGFRVPSALVLTTDFFAPWIARVGAMPAWKALTQATQNDWPALCENVRAGLHLLDWEPEQRRVLAHLARQCTAGGHAARFAVRSSSPDEDLDTASFAGIYTTCLGVPGAELETAIRECFASCLDLPVLSYKAARGLPIFKPDIAIIVQEQIDSDTAGVGFSVNPLTNDNDELLVSANWGLGESVVDGRVMPDQFVLDKTSGRLLDSRLGNKQFSTRLAPLGGTRERDEQHGSRFCLTASQLKELAGAVRDIETLSGRPVDVEFAYAAGVLHILQARPITTCVPLPPSLMSKPGAPRTLYMDIALAKGMTINAPVSPMGQDWLKHTMGQMVRYAAGKIDLALDRADGWVCIDGGRMYLNISRMLWLASPRQLARSNAPTDELLSRLLATIDVARYRSPARPSWLPALRVLPRMLWRLRRALWRSAVAFVAPGYAHGLYRARECEATARLSAPIEKGTTLLGLQQRLGAVAVEAVIDVAMPAMVAGVGAMGAMTRLARKNCAVEQHLVAQLMRGISGNLVVEMGIAMFRLARMLPPADFGNPDLLLARIEAREVPTPFMAEWDRFIATYGCRGPGEMDLANPSYRDDPLMLLRQMSFMASAPAEYDPEIAHGRLARQREQAYRQLLRRFGPVRRVLLKRLYAMTELFAGTRDTPKHFNLLFRQQLRESALRTGSELVDKGHLDNAHDVFGLCYADLDTSATNSRDLRRIRQERGSFLALLARQVNTFPALIDSRGRILRSAPRGDAANQLCGIALSPGLARGRVKCLRSAHEKSVEPGDILVAFTTDPGWTPLFVNAAAIILEVGGVLQHGALVAREFNKPCVAGISDVFAHLRDGQLVEVNGEDGTVSMLDAPALFDERDRYRRIVGYP